MFDVDLDRLRGDAVCDHLQPIFAMRKIMRHVELCVMNGGAGGDPHRRMIECPAEHMANTGLTLSSAPGVFPYFASPFTI